MKYLICDEIQKIKTNFDKPITIVAGLHFKQRDVIRMVEFYSASKYLELDRDELGG